MKEATDSKRFQANLALSSGNRLFASCENRGEGCQYSFILCADGEVITRLDFSERTSAVFWPTQKGEYYVKAIAIHKNGLRETAYSAHQYYRGIEIVIEQPNKPLNALQNTAIVLREIWENRDRMLRLAIYDYRSRDKDSYLGKLWSILNPLIQVLTFWFVFGLGIHGGRPMEGHPYLIWMLCGLFPWFFVSAGIVGGNASIYGKAGMVLRMQYPLATIPTGNILVSFFDHAVTMEILLILLLCYNYQPTFSWLNILYYGGYSIFFLSSLALVTSTLTMIARDFQKLINSLIRLLFYMTPILWSVDSMPEVARFFLKANPVLYLVDGYRDSLLYQVNFWEHPYRVFFFQLVNMGLLICGSTLHRKYRDHFIDFL